MVCVFGASTFSVPPGEFSVAIQFQQPLIFILGFFVCTHHDPLPSFFETMVTVHLGSFIGHNIRQAHKIAIMTDTPNYFMK